VPIFQAPELGALSMHADPIDIAIVAGTSEFDHAIAKLVLAFSTDPVARWMYDEPDQYLTHIPRLFRALGTSSFKVGAAHRSSDGVGVALWLPPGIHSDAGPVESVIAESIASDKQAEVGSLFAKIEDYRPPEPHWYLSLIGIEVSERNKGYGAALLQYGLDLCDHERRSAYLWSSNQLNVSLYRRHGFEILETIQIGSSPPIFPMLRQPR
jgi:ribosomal protein S18 acetylase RimI-like enzyme